MPTFPCPSCGRMVSDQALACPQCGHPFQVQNRSGGVPGWVWGCVVAVPLFFVVSAIVGLLAAIALPSFARAREMAQLSACQYNLEIVHEAVESANELDVRAALNAVCPAGGVYGAEPGAVCSVHGTLTEVRARRQRPASTTHEAR